MVEVEIWKSVDVASVPFTESHADGVVVPMPVFPVTARLEMVVVARVEVAETLKMPVDVAKLSELVARKPPAPSVN